MPNTVLLSFIQVGIATFILGIALLLANYALRNMIPSVNLPIRKLCVGFIILCLLYGLITQAIPYMAVTISILLLGASILLAVGAFLYKRFFSFKD